MSPMPDMEGWVGVTDVASHLGVNKDSIYRWINTKGFPGHRVGRLFRFRLSEVDEWVKNSGGVDSDSNDEYAEETTE